MKFSKSDGAVTAVVCILCAVLLYFFWKDFNSASFLHHGNELGTIEFRKRSATRRSEGNLNWERLKNLSPVYEGDYVRTADFSEAVITFADSQSNINLFANSLLKLNLGNSDDLGSFISGRMTLSGGGGKTIRAGSRLVTFSEDSRLSLSRKDNEITVEMDKGTAVISSEGGEKKVLGTAQELKMDAKTGDYKIIKHEARLVEPEQNEKLLNLSGQNVPVTFKWDEASSGSLPEDLVLQISHNENLEKEEDIPVEGKSTVMALDPGIWYWRLADSKGEISSVRRFTLDRDTANHPILPKDEAAYSYRRILPSIVFSWSPMDSASSYVFEVSAEREFKKPLIRTQTALNTLTVNALDEGGWYWRVRPLYPHRLVSADIKAEIRRITITKRDEMRPLDPSYPLPGSLYQIQDLEGRGLTFTWHPDDEAVEYQLNIADNESMKSPLISLKTPQPFTFLNRQNGGALNREGVFYWSVRWRDDEGNLSPWSAPRKLQGIDGSVAVRLSYPPENYRIADSLISNTRFAWKSNVPGRTVFQVASDSDFQNILYEEDVQAETLLGKNWSAGVWYWRIRTFNADGTVFLETPPRRFSVVPPLAGPVMVQPQRGQIHLFKEGDEQTIGWQKIPGADYYLLNMISSETGKTVYSRNLISGNQISLSLDSIKDGPYVVRIQAFALEKPSSTRIIGYIENNAVAFKQLTPAELVDPEQGQHFDGLTALRQGVDLEWRAKEDPDTSLLTIYREPNLKKPLFAGKDGPRRVNVKPLSAGEYVWTLKGTQDGFDVSARSTGKFIVDPVIPLPPPQLIFPEEGKSFGPEYLRQSREIRLSWEALPGASDYILNIYREDSGMDSLLSVGNIRGNQYVIKDLSLLDKGNFVWSVTGEFRNSKGIVEQPGIKSDGCFSIDLPSLDAPQLKSGDIFFGR